DLNVIRACVLDGVRRCLRGDEIRGGFDLRRHPFCVVHRDVDWDGRPPRKRAKSCLEAALGELGGMDAMGEPPEVVYGSLKAGKSGRDEAAGLRRLVRDQVLRVRELQRDRDELLLGAVVEIALDCPASGVGRTGNSSPRCLYLAQPKLLG